MRNTTYRWALAVLAMMLLTAPALAQENRADTNTLESGQIVTGTLTNATFEIEYTFTGEQGQIVVFELVATEDDTNLDRPELIMLDGDNRPIADTTDFFEFREATLAARLTYNGTYKLLVTREDGRAGDSTGDYQLRMIRPIVLAPGIVVNGAVLNNTLVNYYTISQDGLFTVNYEFSNGELDPHIEAYRVDEGELENIASLRGRELRGGSITLDGNTAEIFIVTVGDSPFATYFDDRIERADYRLSLSLSE